MRVLYVSHSFPPPNDPDANMGGMQRVAIDIYEAFQADKEIEVVPLLLETSWKTTHIKTPFFLISLLWKIPQMIKQHKIESVFFTALVTGWVTLFMKKRLDKWGVKTFVMLYGRDILLPFKPYQWILPKALSKVDTFFPISTATCEEALARNFPKEKTVVVPMGIDISRIGTAVDKVAARKTILETFPSSIDNPFILFSVGRHVKRKGFVWFTEAVMPLLPSNVVYWVGGNGEERPALEAAIAKHELQDRVKLLGYISDESLDLLYQGTDLYVMPNIHVPGDMEGFGVVMLEAGISGLPVVAAGIEGIRDVVHEGKNGHLLPSEDAQAFAKTIMQYAENPTLLQAASAQAQSYVPKTFSWQGIAQQYLTLMQKTHKR